MRLRLASDAASIWPAGASPVREMVSESHARLTKKEFLTPDSITRHPCPQKHSFTGRASVGDDHRNLSCHLARCSAGHPFPCSGLLPFPFSGLWTTLEDQLILQVNAVITLEK